MRILFGSSEPSAVIEVIRGLVGARLVWRCLDGPSDWKGTEISFRLDATPNGATTLLFTHAGWRESSDFMANCNHQLECYLDELKNGAEGQSSPPTRPARSAAGHNHRRQRRSGNGELRICVQRCKGVSADETERNEQYAQWAGGSKSSVQR